MTDESNEVKSKISTAQSTILTDSSRTQLPEIDGSIGNDEDEEEEEQGELDTEEIELDTEISIQSSHPLGLSNEFSITRMSLDSAISTLLQTKVNYSNAIETANSIITEQSTAVNECNISFDHKINNSSKDLNTALSTAHSNINALNKDLSMTKLSNLELSTNVNKLTTSYNSLLEKLITIKAEYETSLTTNNKIMNDFSMQLAASLLVLQEEQSVAQSEISSSSSITPGELIASILSSQIEQLHNITAIGEQSNITNTSEHTDL